MSSKRPERVYCYRGPVERVRSQGQNRPGRYEWVNGYSQTSPEGFVEYPWNTRAECRREAAKAGYKAVFIGPR